MSQLGQWVANCKPDRVERIAAASVYDLVVGPPKPNQINSLEDLAEQGIVGLYRVAKKAEAQIAADQKRYLEESDFMPSPAILKSFLGPLGGSEGGNGIAK